ncbi:MULTISPECIES: D-(-)-3-hydroxybutyrate oligomer hydrolase [unclassified Burkholderia]|uniref:D-(-)-3-hydroxybutyrate oligomer hydrolase n=1 Tax=unclassified Burkholderia TaxID=2613784 RepID=UPI000F56D32F|nr:MULTISPECIES: D-(-)-3-hydroxybutyrate oligomer hydrolase [unclassified Burkholderia]RQR76564.1 D-(-)-3-hydroxybutyrate oligomer hydrolase [Burkholderia sp. Bp9011]RQR87318.1 D-(-)-3-hydroxybutyrate oligomer hydrolase [Burkholderia sp. Bp9010]RQS69727.1 D-(-)-3-hydroxybutyrate oligomer hydrolase [Burkholderia sp. Bp8977]
MTHDTANAPQRHPASALTAACAAVLATTVLAGCNADDGVKPQANQLPAFVAGDVRTTTYDGSTDDLLTGGLGKTGLASATPPAFANAASPVAAELRRLAIWSNYRALVDMSINGGYGRFWGPNVDLAGNDTLGEGKIAGTEYLAFADDGSGTQNVSLLVQVPAGFDPAHPCIVTATSSGSRGVYGAISAAGEWGLKRACAVAYTDKGTGNGAHELATDTVTLIDGTLASAGSAGHRSIFTANVGAATLAAYNRDFPNRYAFKHAHSQQNPEQNWGKDTLEAVQFAYWALNQQFGPLLDGSRRGVRYLPGSISTIAASVSNGGGASLAAAEQDTQGWITAVVVGEPQVNVNMGAGAQVREGGSAISAAGKPLADYMTLANMLQPCAAAASELATAPYLSALPHATTNSIRAARCSSLAAAGVISGNDLQSQASSALAQLHAAGYETDSDFLQAPMWDSQAVPAVAATYANAYTRSSATDNLCGFSFGTTNASGAAAAPAGNSPMLNVFGTGNGVPPTNGINLVYNAGATGAADHRLATSDASYAGAACLHALWTQGNPAMAASVSAVRVTGKLQNKPTIIVQGRSDALVPVNHASRAYLAQNSIADGAHSQLSFYEITNGQHFDAFLSVAGFDTRFIPVHYYYLQALNLMWDRLTRGTPLPPSQVVRTTPRGGVPGQAPQLAAANLPPIASVPAANAIHVANGIVDIPH